MKNQLYGLIAGCALGDSWGMATEMFTRDHIKSIDFNEKIMNPSFSDSIISKKRPSGSVTDDTLNTLMILEMLKHNGGKISSQDYINMLKQWHENSPIAGFVTGPSTSKALEAIDKGVPISETGKFGTTNGGVMKIAPLGYVLDYNDMEALVEGVYAVCLPTHNTTIAIQGAASIAALSSSLFRRKCFDAESMVIVKNAIDVAKVYGTQWPSANLWLRIQRAIQIAELPQDEALDRLYDEIGSTWETIDTVSCVFALLKMSNWDLYRYCELSSQLGGDTDTIGAIGGALCGLLNPKQIKQKDIEVIEKVNEFKIVDYLF